MPAAADGSPAQRAPLANDAENGQVPPALRPGTNRDVLHIVSLAQPQPELVKDLMVAAEAGFFYIKDHGIPQAVIDEAYAATVRVTELPHDVKKKTQDKTSSKEQGEAYTLGWSEQKNKTARMSESFMCRYDNPGMAKHWVPEEDCPGHKKAVLDLMQHNWIVADKIMTCFALGLGLPEDFFRGEMDPKHPTNCTAMNCNRYHKLDDDLVIPQGILRILAHCDFEVLTLLHTRVGEPGLEVCPGRDATTANVMDTEWTDMPPIEGCITVNMGEALEYWTDGALKACFHRVRCPRPGESRKERMSLAHFANARSETIFQGPKKRWPPMNFQQIMDDKANVIKEDKAKLGDKKEEEMEIEEVAARQAKLVLGPVQPTPCAAPLVQADSALPLPSLTELHVG